MLSGGWVSLSLSLRFDRRGSMLDVLGVIIGMIVLIVSAVMGNLLYNEARSLSVWNEFGNSTINQGILSEGDYFYNTVPDNLIIFLFVGLTLAGICSAVVSKAHPLFLWIAIIVMLLLMVFAVVVSNWYEMFMQDSTVAGVSANFTKTSVIMGNLPLMCLMVMFIIGIVLYAINRKRSSAVW